MIKILLADEHTLFRAGIKRIIAAETDMQVVTEAKDAEEALNGIRGEEINLIILSINIYGRSGLDILPDIKMLKPETPVLILTSSPEDEFARRCFKQGAAGYMNKDTEPEEFILALRKLHKGMKYISPAFAESLLSEINNIMPARKLHDSLSDREFEVFRMLASGLRNVDISHKIALSEKTVSTYRVRILEKLRLKTNEEIKYYARQYGLI